MITATPMTKVNPQKINYNYDADPLNGAFHRRVHAACTSENAKSFDKTVIYISSHSNPVAQYPIGSMGNIEISLSFRATRTHAHTNTGSTVFVLPFL